MWQDLYRKVDYSLAWQGDQLRIESSLSFSSHPKMDQAWADDVTLSPCLLDDRGVVPSYLGLAHTLGSRLDDSIPFRRVLSHSKEMTAIWFGFEGKFRGRKEDGPLSVWKRPKQSSWVAVKIKSNPEQSL